MTVVQQPAINARKAICFKLMPRYKITIEYDGTPFAGWQIQENGPSVQGCLAEAIACFSGKTCVPQGAGRTDAGVHARGQVAHFDLTEDWPADTVRDAINFHLKPNPIAVLDCAKTAPDFDARFSATARHYQYVIINRRAPLTLDKDRAWRVPKLLNERAMQEAAKELIGKHDFTTFRSAHCQAKSPVKTLDKLMVARKGETIIIEASARSFLHHQVRSIVGSLKLVGEGKWTPADLRRALEARDRAACGPVAPANGLYLIRIEYDHA